MKKILISFMVLLSLIGLVVADGNLTGTVTDYCDNPIVGVTVALNTSLTNLTDSNGLYFIHSYDGNPNIDNRTYTLRANITGYKIWTETIGMTQSNTSTATRNLNMKVDGTDWCNANDSVEEGMGMIGTLLTGVVNVVLSAFVVLLLIAIIYFGTDLLKGLEGIVGKRI